MSTLAPHIRGGSIEKFQAILAAADQEELDPGSQPYQDANLARTLRNRLIHFEPSDTTIVSTIPGIPDEPHNLEKKLDGKFRRHSWYMESKTAPRNHLLSTSCAAWCVASTRAFADEVFSRLGSEPLYAVVQDEVDELLECDLDTLYPDDGV